MKVIARVSVKAKPKYLDSIFIRDHFICKGEEERGIGLQIKLPLCKNFEEEKVLQIRELLGQVSNELEQKQ